MSTVCMEVEEKPRKQSEDRIIRDIKTLFEQQEED